MDSAKLRKRLGRLDGQAAFAAFSRRLYRHSAILLAGLLAVLAALAGSSVLGLRVPVPDRRTIAFGILALMALVALAAAVSALLGRPGKEGAARAVDRLLSLEDRNSTSPPSGVQPTA